MFFLHHSRLYKVFVKKMREVLHLCQSCYVPGRHLDPRHRLSRNTGCNKGGIGVSVGSFRQYWIIISNALYPTICFEDLPYVLSNDPAAHPRYPR